MFIPEVGERAEEAVARSPVVGRGGDRERLARPESGIAPPSAKGHGGGVRYALDIKWLRFVVHVVVRVVPRIGVYIDVRVGLSELGARIVVRMR